jgi:hypothetical protein
VPEVTDDGSLDGEAPHMEVPGEEAQPPLVGNALRGDGGGDGGKLGHDRVPSDA